MKLASLHIAVFIAILELAVLEVSFAQECEAQVVLTTQAALKKQITSDIAEALEDFSCSGTTNAPSTESQEALSRLESKLDALNNRIDLLQKRLNVIHEDGSTPCYAADSCAEILSNKANSLSGYYWVKNATGHSHSVYCDMTRSCGGVTGGWMRVSDLNMRNSSHWCPSGLRQRTDSNVRTCAPQSDSATCSSIFLPSSGIHYSKVCGKIKGYYGNSLDGFYDHGRGTSLTIDSNYVDGVSLTHGRGPRQHIWTFVAIRACPCGPTPAFVNNNFFCDGGTGRVDLNNPLWDGGRCSSNTCCNINTPPWFYQQLSRPTTDDIEMRVCRDQDRGDEDVLIEKIEIYVQ